MKRAMLCALVMTMAIAASAEKTARTYYDADRMARMHALVETQEWAQAQVEAARAAAEWYLQFSDEELWEFVPPPEQMRAINVNIGHDCPTCGEEITRKAGHYPWTMDRDRPFKLTCPVCEQTFPANDFEPWNTEGLEGEPATGDTPTDYGLGWLGPDGHRYWFVSYYIFWQRWNRDILGGMEKLGQAYLLTGDERYARACAIIMTKVASEYERLDYPTQGYHEGYFGVTGRISDHIWTTGDDIRIALAYDAIWPAFDANPELLAFLQAKGIADPRRTIEQGMLAVMERDVLGGVNAIGNMGMHQRTACVLAIVLNNEDPEYAPTTEQMREWLMSGAGRVEDLLWNGFWRDGMGAESATGYSAGWISNFYEVADLLPKLGVDIWDNPKLKKMADIGIDMAVNNRWGPDIGDAGGPKSGGPIGRWPKVLGQAFTHYGELRHAQALAAQNAKSRDLFVDWFDEEAVAAAVADHGTDLTLGTRNIGGYGLAILEAGEGESARGMTLYYGSAEGGHGHHDRLNIELWALGRAMMPEDGYPFPFTRPDFWRWRSTDTHKHYCVVVDESSHQNLRAGDLNALLSTPGVQFVDASAGSVYPGLTSLYRRTAALIDSSPDSSYLLDIFRVRGGSQHDWCFHGPSAPEPWFELALEGGTLGPAQEQGTLAGPDVPFGTEPPGPYALGDGTSGYHGLYNVRRMKPEGQWRAAWRNAEEIALTMTMPAGLAQEVIVCDASPELQPGNPDEIQYVIARRTAAEPGLASTFVATAEPHRGEPAIERVELLPGSDQEAGVVGVAVHRAGAVDLVHSAPERMSREWAFGDRTLSVDAEYALVTLDEAGVSRAMLVNGASLRLGEFALEGQAALEAPIAAVDANANTLTIGATVPDPEALVGRVVILGNDLQSTSYTVTEAAAVDGGTRLGFGDVLLIVGMGEVAATDAAAGTITSDRNLQSGARTDGGHHEGRWLFTEDRSRGWRIATVDRTTLTLQEPPEELEAAFPDADGDGRRLYWIVDAGPGDVCRIPAVTWYERE